jgi:hypothetical protein
VRKAGAAMIADAIKRPKQLTFLFVNNHLEGNALQVIGAMLSKPEISDYLDG